MAKQLIELPSGQHLIIDAAATPPTRSEFLSESPWKYGGTGATGSFPTTAVVDITSTTLFPMHAMDTEDIAMLMIGQTPTGYTVIR